MNRLATYSCWGSSGIEKSHQIPILILKINFQKPYNLTNDPLSKICQTYNLYSMIVFFRDKFLDFFIINLLINI